MISINKRKIGVCILLLIVTFGLYQIYWEYLLVKNTRAIKNDDSSCTGEMLCLIFVPFYPLYWWFTRGKLVKEKFAEQGYSAKGNEGTYLILSIFCLVIVCLAIMQRDFNFLPSESTMSVQPSTNHKIKTAAVIIAAFVIFEAVCFAGYCILYKYIERIDMRADCGAVEEYMKNDSKFESQYGEVVSVKLDDKEKYEIIGAHEVLLPCHVTVEDGTEYLVWVNHFVDAYTESIEYESVNIRG